MISEKVRHPQRTEKNASDFSIVRVGVGYGHLNSIQGSNATSAPSLHEVREAQIESGAKVVARDPSPPTGTVPHFSCHR